MDAELPKETHPNTEKEDDNLATALVDNDDPIPVQALNKLKLDPSLTLSNAEIVDPCLMKDLRLSADPIQVKSNTDRLDPKVANP